MSAPLSCSKSRGTTHFLLGLEAFDDRRKLAENLICLLVVLNLSGDELGQVSEGLGGVEDLYIVSKVCPIS